MAVRDTSPEARRVQVSVYRSMAPARRVAIALEMSEDVRRVARAGARQRAAGKHGLRSELDRAMKDAQAGWLENRSAP